MAIWRRLAVILLWLAGTVIGGVDGSLVTVPANTAVVEGNSTLFTCRIDTSQSVQWILDGLPTDIPPVVLFDGSSIHAGYENRYSIISTDGVGQYDLRLVNASRRDAGLYMCSEIETGENASAIFVVLAAEPNCTSSAVSDGAAENDTVGMRCEAWFNGTAWQIPRMAWFLDVEFLTNQTEVWDKHVLVWSWYNYTAVMPTTLDYRCETYFNKPVPSSDQPNNLSQAIPSLTFNWIAPVVRLLYAPWNTTIRGVEFNESLPMYSVLGCWSDANPPPTYDWTDVHAESSVDNEGSSGSGAEFDIVRPGWRLITCTATNTIHKQNTSDSASVRIYVVGGDEINNSGLSAGAISGAVIGSICGVALIAGLTYIALRYYRKQDNESHAVMSESVYADCR